MGSVSAELDRLERAKANPGNSPAVAAYIDRMLTRVRSQLPAPAQPVRKPEDGEQTPSREKPQDRVSALETLVRDQAEQLAELTAQLQELRDRQAVDATAARLHHTRELARAEAALEFHRRALAKLGPEPDT